MKKVKTTIEWIPSKRGRVPKYGTPVSVWFGDHKPHAHRHHILIARRTKTDISGEHWDCDYGHHITHYALLPEGPDLDTLHTTLQQTPDVEIEFAPEPLGAGEVRHMMTNIPGGIRVEFLSPSP